ncbi:uncharacterized protein BO66DRAFT_391382 [Aspergillus aculeatinus CBS 121060]|uniref:Uncharacterized protein n=1 Tax=Aspergillus aculeatinus CBS 121060 TaxID=1448322 RepID=A0ACD1HAV7_9EURO|nr:hypothetical protein BO66DRAFT_391382 [Aspergillus aculeatinus CBS 121060]RAH70941.1 hypothetical protein BO66DRAFT_391382 [Aspergillus aculeatinus CBS 121060]
MPPPSWQRHEVEPPEHITSEAVRGFLTGAFRFGSVSIIAHMIMTLPHPFKFSPASSAPVPSQPPNSARLKQSPFSKDYIRSRLFHRPLEGFSDWLSPASRVYRGLTPQFKVFLQIGAMTLGGYIWAEKRVDEYIKFVRKVKRAEKLQAERAAKGLD